jgi:thioesterase domain-containing protein
VEVGPTQDFFELGGNSIVALRLFAAANHRLGCDLPVATLYAGATVREMADAVREQRRAAPSAPSPIVPMQPGGSLPPLFCVHPAGRRVMAYVNLVRHLGSDQPVYGLQDLGDDLSRPVAQVAAEHVASLRQVQPRGPYYLVGWSYGGAVAYEMASQLEAAGETVAFVGLLDTVAPHIVQSLPQGSDADLVIGLSRDIAEQMGRSVSIPRDSLEGAEFDEQLRRAVESLHAQGAAPADFDPEALREECQIIRARNRSISGYVPGPFSGTLTVFPASEVPEEYVRHLGPLSDLEKRTLGWSALSSKPVEVHAVPGSHVTLGSEPNVRTLTARMREALAAARARAASTAPAAEAAR